MMRVNGRTILAISIFVIIGGWLLSGQFGDRRSAGALLHKETAGEEKPAEDNALFRVRATRLTAQARTAEIKIRGRTEAIRAVEVRTETAGMVTNLFVDKGDKVDTGDKLCGLAVDARAAKLAEARAGLRKAELDRDAAIKLADKGFRSETQVASAQAAYDAARATVRQMEIEVERTTIRAPFPGTVDDRFVEIGDYLQAGQGCALVVDLDPIRVIGAVSEREVSSLHAGDPAKVQLIGGQTVTGTVSFIARSADETTRTFRIEVEVPNPDGLIRDGITADIQVGVEAVMAHRITPAILTLDEQGILGVRIVDQTGTVQFKPVQIISDGVEGVWITGLPDPVTVITVGQEYVSSGQKVEVDLDKSEVKS